MPRRGLSKQIVIEAAARLAGEQGSVDSLSLADLAAALDVKPPSLYNHIDGLDGLRRDLTLHALALLRDALRDALVGRSGDDALLACGYAYRTFILTHPALAPLVIPAPPSDDLDWMMISESIISLLLSALSAYHLERDESVHIIRGLRAFVHGFTTLEIAGGFGIPLDTGVSFDRLLRGYIAGVQR